MATKRKKTKNSNRKGKVGERELARKLREYGYEEARRSEQYCGKAGDADIIGLPGIHIECKRVERLSVYKALDQAREERKEDTLPIVAHRKNHEEWIIIQPLKDWIELYRAYEKEKR